MKQILLRYASYNLWANRHIIACLLQLNKEEREKEIVSSFCSVSKTALHTWSAEDIWLQRLQLVEQPVWKQGIFQDSLETLCAGWTDTSSQLELFVSRQTEDADFQREIPYLNLRQEPMKFHTADILLHVFNHSTYHRGQLVTMLRQLGKTDIPATDLIRFPSLTED